MPGPRRARKAQPCAARAGARRRPVQHHGRASRAGRSRLHRSLADPLFSSCVPPGDGSRAGPGPPSLSLCTSAGCSQPWVSVTRPGDSGEGEESAPLKHKQSVSCAGLSRPSPSVTTQDSRGHHLRAGLSCGPHWPGCLETTSYLAFPGRSSGRECACKQPAGTRKGRGTELRLHTHCPRPASPRP